MTISPGRTGLCSVTFRDLMPAEVISAGLAADLTLVEWGSDVHAPPNAPHLDDLSGMTIDAGMLASSYGTYWHAGSSDREEIPALMEAARRLRTPRMRIWTAKSPGKIDRRVVADVQAIADEANEHDIVIALEYHEGTTTDRAPRVLDLLDAADRPNVTSYWQPTVGPTITEQLQDLELMVDHVAALHVFGLAPDGQIAALSRQAALWEGALGIARAAEHEIDLLLEFVPGDNLTGLKAQASQLAALTIAVREPSVHTADATVSSSIFGRSHAQALLPPQRPAGSDG